MGTVPVGQVDFNRPAVERYREFEPDVRDALAARPGLGQYFYELSYFSSFAFVYIYPMILRQDIQMVNFPALKHGIENAGEKAAATISDNDIREVGIAVYKAV